jgi:hypothetical protein
MSNEDSVYTLPYIGPTELMIPRSDPNHPTNLLTTAIHLDDIQIDIIRAALGQYAESVMADSRLDEGQIEVESNFISEVDTLLNQAQPHRFWIG